MGSHFIEAAIQRDYTLAMGALLTYTVLLFVMNIGRPAYSIIDPRVAGISHHGCNKFSL